MDKQSMETCPASGGERMLLEGHNFQHDSKVVFVEKALGKKRGVVKQLCVFVCVSLSVVVQTPALVPPITPTPKKKPSEKKSSCQSATCGAH